MMDNEKKIYRLICYYVGTKIESVGRVRARNEKDALEYAENYYTTICMTIRRIEVYESSQGQLAIAKNYAG